MSWIAPALLGAYHGFNPAMGWLFAAALGLQERRVGAVTRALPLIALGHAASVAVVVAFATVAQLLVPLHALRIVGAMLLVGYAIHLIVGRAHPRRVGMRLGARGLVAWSFVMATAHGAGLMLLPFLLGDAGSAMAGPAHAHMAGVEAHAFAAGAGAGIVFGAHTVAMVTAMSAAALAAYRAAGVGILRRFWLDTDLLWSATLAAGGVAVLVA
jgi:hypothetical protein